MTTPTPPQLQPPLAAAPEPLFDGHDGLFLDALRGVERYGEYGMGQSTRAVAQSTSARIQAVDTSLAWRDRVWADLDDAARSRTSLLHVDLGPVGNWGFPKSYERRDAIPDYFAGPWIQDFDPQLVLVDGRFRVACFLTCLLNATPGTRILFDDYTERGYYHIVETLVAPKQVTARQALFEVPPGLDAAGISKLLAQFSMVMD